MRRHFTAAILVPAILMASPGLVFSQEPAADRSQRQATAHEPGSPEEALAQLSSKIAAIYRAMAGIAASDPNRTSELKAHYARLAEQEENAARAMQSMAAYHQAMAGASHQASPEKSSKLPNYGDSAFRR